jgi:hypothetical protein
MKKTMRETPTQSAELNNVTTWVVKKLNSH